MGNIYAPREIAFNLNWIVMHQVFAILENNTLLNVATANELIKIRHWGSNLVRIYRDWRDLLESCFGLG